jgi:ubiquinone/menaquinone biosynthesis C-methylase UbiE
MQNPKEVSIYVPDLRQRVVEQTEIVDGADAERYIHACDYPETSDYGILSEEVDKKFGIRDKSILEIGSGPGNLCAELLAKGAKLVTGVDAAETMVEYAVKKYQSHQGHMRFIDSSVYELPFAPHQFDIVVSQNTWHQFYHPFEALQEAIWVTSPGGVVYIADFRRDVPEDRFRERILYTKPEIREDLINSVRASLTKQEFMDMLHEIDGISFSVNDAEDPRGLSQLVDEMIKKDPVPHFRDYLISLRVEIHKNSGPPWRFKRRYK